MSPRFVRGRENVPCVAEVVNRSLKADCTDFTRNCYRRGRTTKDNETELSEDSHHNKTDNSTTETVNNSSDNNDLIIPNKELYENIQTVFREICSEEGEMSKRMYSTKTKKLPTQKEVEEIDKWKNDTRQTRN